MNTQTVVRNGPCGLILTRGKRELHLLGTSVEQVERARTMAAGVSFDVLFKRARRAPHSRNTAFIKVGSEDGF